MHRTVSYRQALVSLLFILGSSTLLSQVNIKERVEIKPKPPLQKSSIQNVALFAANPDSNQGRHQEGAILVQYPCRITVTATMDVQPGSDGGYPPTDLAMFSSSGTLIAWYKGYPDGTHGSSGGTASYAMTCGRTGVALSNTMGYDDVTNVTRSIGSSSATITFKGKLLQYWTFTATATLTATVDDSYDLATVELLPASSQITQCESIAYLHAKLTNNKGESYTGIPCQGPPPPMTLTVESGSDVQLSCAGQQGEELTVAAGDVDVTVSWNYQGETENSTATVTLTAEGKTSSATVDLVVDKTLRWLEFEDIDNVLYLTKTKVRVALYDCSSWGGGPLLDGSLVDLEITEGAEFGSLVDPKTGQEGKKLTSVSSQDGFVEVEYWANGANPPERWERVVIQATSGEASDQGSLYVFPGDLMVTLGRSEINFGDTTGIIPGVVRPWGGSPSPVSQDWQTMYQVVKADTIGYFYSPDSSKTGSPLIGQYPEARFYAKNYTSPPDSVVVVIKVTAVDPNGGGVVKIVDGEHPTKGQPRTKSLRSTKTSLKSTTGGKKNKVMDEPPNLGEGSYHYGAAQLVVKKKADLDHFDVTLESNEIAYSEASKIFVTAKDPDESEIPLSDEEKLTYVLEGPQSMYGRFIDAKGDTVLFVENARYIDAKQGLIKVAAVHQNPANPITARIKVVRASDPTKSGETDVRIVEQTIKLVLYGPQELWPVLPPYTQEKSHENNRTLLEVQMTRNGKPLAGHLFRLSADYVIGSGGHNHTEIKGVYKPPRRPNAPRIEMFRNYGMFVSAQRDPKTANANPIEEQTLENGKSAFGYVASHFGDRMILKVESKKSSLLWDTISVVERVPDLELLPPSDYFDRIGGTNKHHGPSDKSESEVPTSCRTPDNNHWGMRYTLIGIDSIAANYHRLFPKNELLHINDISLPLGGRFDIYGPWIGTLDHEYHRFGRDVDVKRSTIPSENEPSFEQLCRSFGVVDPDPENKAHYHLYFWDREQ